GCRSGWIWKGLTDKKKERRKPPSWSLPEDGSRRRKPLIQPPAIATDTRMSENSFAFPHCTSCNRPILPRSKSSRFYCPNCHQVLIWRDELCRQFSRRYKCANCGFEGP